MFSLIPADLWRAERPSFRRMAVPVVLASALIGHGVNAADGALWIVVLAMAAVAVIGLAMVSIKYQRETGHDWRRDA